MKKTKIMALMLGIVIMLSCSVTASAETIPRESFPKDAPQEAVAIAQSLIGNTLDKVTAGLGYADARAETNNIIFRAVLAKETSGYGYGILTAIANNAIFEYRDIYLRPEYYKEAEEKVRALISDIITDVENGKDYEQARKEAYTRIYQSVNPAYNPDELFLVDFCYWDIPAVDSAMFNRARKLLMNAYDVHLQNQN